jgi:hypothetical protein
MSHIKCLYDHCKKMSMLYNLSIITLFILIIIVILLICKWLWNNVLIKLFPFINKVSSVWQIIGLMILLSFLFLIYLLIY